MDPSQIIVSVCLILITITLVALGVYLITVLVEIKNSLSRVNRILETTETITEAVAAPVSSFSEFVMGFKNGFTVFNKFFKNKKSIDD